MKRVYVKEEVCIGCQLCDVYYRLQLSAETEGCPSPTGSRERKTKTSTSKRA